MNRTRKPKTVSSLLQKNKLQHDTNLIIKLDSLLQSYLKQHNIHGCRIGNLINGCLLIEIPDATWQIRLQFIKNELLTELRCYIPSLLNIKIKVNPRLKTVEKKNVSKPQKNIKRATKMSVDVAQSFLSLADNADPELQKALRSLAKYSK